MLIIQSRIMAPAAARLGRQIAATLMSGVLGVSWAVPNLGDKTNAEDKQTSSR